jgi:hypothetical protein
MRLIGESSTNEFATTPRKAIKIDPEVRNGLTALLFEPEMRGVGYSEFIQRAVKAAHEEIEFTRYGRER